MNPDVSLEDRIRQEIQHHGPMNVGAFMGLAVSHYYGSRDPFGAGGDFTTAPEISQMFGELLGAWAADCWAQMGHPERFVLAECGPGRGTLMADALRATKGGPRFHAAAEVHLIEQSALLQEKQRDMLRDYKVTWHGDVGDLPNDVPLVLLANEFLDALPVRQFQFGDGAWQERVIGLDEGGTLQFGLVPASGLVPEVGGTEGGIAELSPAVSRFAETVAARIMAQGGAALFIDYGYAAGQGNTLQAVRRHEYVDVLSHIGEADLTAHVDFAALAKAVCDCAVYGPVTQGEFLQRLGIGPRAAVLQLLHQLVW